MRPEPDRIARTASPVPQPEISSSYRRSRVASSSAMTMRRADEGAGAAAAGWPPSTAWLRWATSRCTEVSRMRRWPPAVFHACSTPLSTHN